MISEELAYYTKNPKELSTAMKHLRRIYGDSEAESVRRQVKAYSKRLSPKIAMKKEYEKKVRELTEIQPLSLLSNYEKRAFKGFHVDHIVSISEAFKLGWPPDRCANISNLQMLPYKDNMVKGCKSMIAK